MVFTNHVFAVGWAEEDGAVVGELELADVANRGDGHRE